MTNAAISELEAALDRIRPAMQADGGH